MERVLPAANLISSVPVCVTAVPLLSRTECVWVKSRCSDILGEIQFHDDFFNQTFSSNSDPYTLQVSKYKMELIIPASIVIINSVRVLHLRPPLPPDRFRVCSLTCPFFTPNVQNASSTSACPPAPTQSLVAVSVHMVKVHLHHADPAAG